VAAPSDERLRLGQQAEKFSEEDLTRFFNILLAIDDDLRRKPDPRLHLEMGLLRLINAQKLAPLEEVLAEMRGEQRVRPREKARAVEAAPLPSAVAPPASPSAKSTAASSTAAGSHTASPSSPASAGFASAGSVRPASAAPLPVSPPRIVTRAAEEGDGLAGARLEAIKAALHESKLLSSFLEQATRCEIEASEFRLFFTTENSALAEMLPREAMERLRTAVQQVIGQPLRVCVKLDSARTLAARGSELRARFEKDPVVRAMLEKFGGQISRVKRPGED
jgi:DNA polymerase III gamma/tau subunit